MNNKLENSYGLLDPIPNPVLVVKGGEIVYENEAARRLLVEMAVGKRAGDIFDPMLLGGGEAPIVGTFKHRNGTYTVHSALYGDERILTLSSDPGDEEVSDRSLNSLICSIRSGVGTLMTAMTLMHDKNPQLPREIVGDLAITSKSTCMLAREADNFARIFCGLDTRPIMMPIDITNLVEDITNSVVSFAPKNAPKIVCLTDGKPLPFMADGHLLEVAMMHLLSNAIKFTGKDGNISVSLKNTSKNVNISVSDDGCGVRPEFLTDVFRRYKFPRTYSQPKTGSGLGLSIVQQIAGLHGGSAVLESAYGHGTTVTVRLPRRVRVAADAELSTEYKSGAHAILMQMSDVVDSSVFEKWDVL